MDDESLLLLLTQASPVGRRDRPSAKRGTVALEEHDMESALEE